MRKMTNENMWMKSQIKGTEEENMTLKDLLQKKK
jgi:hypothetical protein